jgi:peptide-methionine (S)-S-oxide reductase
VVRDFRGENFFRFASRRLCARVSIMASAHSSAASPATESLVLGGGCFWCTEAAYKLLPGVKHVTSGYAGGKEQNPTYDQICAHATSHAEVI